MKTVEKILKRSALSQYQNKFLVDVEDMDWIVEQIEKVERYEKALTQIETSVNIEDAKSIAYIANFSE